VEFLEMAVGDLVSDSQNVTFTFQPAAGIQICITQFLTNSDGGNSRISGLGDIDTLGGTLQTRRDDTVNGTYYVSSWSGNNFKFFIDNSSYLSFAAYSGAYTGYSGIQTQ
tara:strand:+ start:1072 stop:1401 length:330 start_codon:yes stop_codon:yes gene_type:complete